MTADHPSAMLYSVIGCTGLIGGELLAQVSCGQGYSRQNISTFLSRNHDVVVISAPSGNRLLVNQAPQTDLENCQSIIKIVKESKYNKLIHISTVDVFVDTAYGQNRCYLEKELGSLINTHTIRLPSICGENIQKNILYDLRHKKWLDKISLKSQLQWYPLNRLNRDIETVLSSNCKIVNLVSPPVTNQEIVAKYFPNLLQTLRNDQTAQYYDLKFNNQYWVPINEIWASFDEYFSK